MGATLFDGARFLDSAAFSEVLFQGPARFDKAVFEADTDFLSARFADRVRFAECSFHSTAMFSDVSFEGPAWFDGSTFNGPAFFARTCFSEDAWFAETTFLGTAWFDAVRCDGEVHFDSATFHGHTQLGPLSSGKDLNLSRATFNTPPVIEAAAPRVLCRQTRWTSTATLRLRYASVDLSDAVADAPVKVSAHARPFIGHQQRVNLNESALGSWDPGVRITSLRGVDTSHVILTDVDLSGCQITGAVNLDRIRLEGRCTFASSPTGWHWRRWRPFRWTRRRILAEEQHWRATSGYPGWVADPTTDTPGPAGPETLAPTYRHLRKSFEDAKNEPDAADFYYGEMEMRRHDRQRPRAERVLLAAYWALSGYGMRASRALGWLAAAMAISIVLLMSLGLPDRTPREGVKQISNSTGQVAMAVIEKPEPELTLPLDRRFTAKRFDQALQIMLNSVVFRSSGQNLTTWGTYTEMLSRTAEPLLLGLAVLAVRGRIKRG
ncbi:pentapeptide repeat-containing protein [Streptomyces sp. A1547]|uniref:pentapeptide repeat-containing protein n=1 Tax=Streptomyces sp. A1547 TaxID=2563105 RepID=UPI001F0F2FE2|nr:pentapeptide repeat-containing protein [Streptomyces sp. A1547]